MTFFLNQKPLNFCCEESCYLVIFFTMSLGKRLVDYKVTLRLKKLQNSVTYFCRSYHNLIMLPDKVNKIHNHIELTLISSDKYFEIFENLSGEYLSLI